jgi:hypothetical protein
MGVCGFVVPTTNRPEVTLTGSGTLKHLLQKGNLCEAKFDSEVGESGAFWSYATHGRCRRVHTQEHTCSCVLRTTQTESLTADRACGYQGALECYERAIQIDGGSCEALLRCSKVRAAQSTPTDHSRALGLALTGALTSRRSDPHSRTRMGSVCFCQALSDLTLEPGTSEGDAQAMTRRAVVLAEAARRQDAADARTHLAIAINLARLAVYSDNKTKVSLVRQVRCPPLRVIDACVMRAQSIKTSSLCFS